MPNTSVGPLHKFADFVREERTWLTGQWMKAVFRDENLVEADKLTYQQLADHLPEILDGLCAALDVEDLERVERAIEHDAREHPWCQLTQHEHGRREVVGTRRFALRRKSPGLSTGCRATLQDRE